MLDVFKQIATLIADGSGWVLFAASWVLFGYLLLRGVLVPGWVHRREVVRGDRAEDAVEQSTRTVHEAAAAATAATDTARAVADELRAFRIAVQLGRSPNAPD